MTCGHLVAMVSCHRHAAMVSSPLACQVVVVAMVSSHRCAAKACVPPVVVAPGCGRPGDSVAMVSAAGCVPMAAAAAADCSARDGHGSETTQKPFRTQAT